MGTRERVPFRGSDFFLRLRRGVLWACVNARTLPTLWPLFLVFGWSAFRRWVYFLYVSRGHPRYGWKSGSRMWVMREMLSAVILLLLLAGPAHAAGPQGGAPGPQSG